MNLELITREPEKNLNSKHILFVHGSWHAAWCWDEYFLPYFTNHGYTCHAVSLRGHGKSKSNKHFRFLSIMDYVKDIEEIRKKLPEISVIVGHSMGGLIIQKYLETHHVPVAVLLASIPVHGAIYTTLRFALKHPLAFLKTHLTLSLYPVINSPKLTQEAFFSSNIAENKLNKYFSLMQNESYRAFLNMIFCQAKPKKVKTDILVLGAENDTFFYTDEIKKTASAYNTEAEIFPDMAHDMMLESGWENVADYILNWLKNKNI